MIDIYIKIKKVGLKEGTSRFSPYGIASKVISNFNIGN